MNTETFTVQRPTRWDASFDPEMTQANVDRIFGLAPFKDMDPERFPKHLGLRQIIEHDTRLRSYDKGEIIVREGDYGHSAFLVLSGGVRVVLSPSLPAALLGRRPERRKNIFRVIAQLWMNAKEPEQFDAADLKQSSSLGTRKVKGDDVRIFLQGVPRVLDSHRTALIEPGEFFGEIAALSRTPRTATVFAGSDASELLEIRWQGLRDIMRYDDTLRRHIDRIYRERALQSHLQAIPLFQFLSDADRTRVADAAGFETFGNYEWSGDYKRMAQKDPARRPQEEPLIAREGEYPNSVVLIRAGFARYSQQFGQSERTLNYLGAGHVYGLAEIAHNWRNPKSAVALQHSLRAMGYTHVLVIPTSVMEQVVLPSIPEKEWDRLVPGIECAAKANGMNTTQDLSRRLGMEMLEFLTDNRIFNGTASMLINLDRCTRCDDCVRACAAAHDNNPRFLRHGPTNHHVMVANACMHCVDPVCMIGCPTGAIHRNQFGGQVVINSTTCIGCQTCFNNCPYNAIRMVEVRDARGDLWTDPEGKPILKATKCDLCVDQVGGPACARACPHGALSRMNMNDLNGFANWLQG